jgi:hypothetical protein
MAVTKGSALRLLLPCLLVYLMVGMLMRWGNISQHPIIDSDGKGYYAYLPAILIHQDLSFGFVDDYEAKYYEPSHRVDFKLQTEQGTVNKYFVGTAVLMAPFFVLGHIAAHLNGAPPDGYSWPYQMAMVIGAVFWLFMGAWLFFRFLEQRGSGAAGVKWAVLALLFATGLFYYAVAEPTMSHVYSMAMVCAALFLSQRYFADGQMRHLALLGAVLGLVALIRPVNILVVLALPLAASGVGQVRSRLPQRGNLAHWSAATVVFLLVCSLQPLIYWLQTGSPWVWSYGEEGFDFSRPEVMNVLFSYRKGLFVYTPVALLALLGILWHVRRNALQAGSALAFLGIITWVISSWWMWFYGGSFGMRPYLEFMPVFLMGIVWMFEHFGKWPRRLLMGVLALLMYVNLVQSYQYQQNILLWDGMTKEAYWGSFLKADRALIGYYHDWPQKWAYKGIDSLTFAHDFEQPKGWKNEETAVEGDAHSGGRYADFGRLRGFGPVFNIELDSLTLQGMNTVRLEAMVRVRGFRTGAGWVVSIQDSVGVRYWAMLPISPQIDGGGWQRVSHVFKVGPQAQGARLEAYLHKTDPSALDIDDMKVMLIHAE